MNQSFEDYLTVYYRTVIDPWLDEDELNCAVSTWMETLLVEEWLELGNKYAQKRAFNG